jgi:hypothetical protein
MPAGRLKIMYAKTWLASYNFSKHVVLISINSLDQRTQDDNRKIVCDILNLLLGPPAVCINASRIFGRILVRDLFFRVVE